MVEGFLAIAPYACVGALSRLPAAAFEELASLQARVRRFYASAYQTNAVLFYEQGRGGGGASVDALERFPLHAHLCSLPMDVPLHTFLAQRYRCLSILGLAELRCATGNQPYLYVEAAGRCAAYVAGTKEQIGEIEQARLKPMIARLMGLGERGDWRAYPGEHELAQVTQKWFQSGANSPPRSG